MLSTFKDESRTINYLRFYFVDAGSAPDSASASSIFCGSCGECFHLFGVLRSLALFLRCYNEGWWGEDANKSDEIVCSSITTFVRSTWSLEISWVALRACHLLKLFQCLKSVLFPDKLVISGGGIYSCRAGHYPTTNTIHWEFKNWGNYILGEFINTLCGQQRVLFSAPWVPEPTIVEPSQ